MINIDELSDEEFLDGVEISERHEKLFLYFEPKSETEPIIYLNPNQVQRIFDLAEDGLILRKQYE